MRFGLQKMTLLDYPGKVACTVFSCGCNFRCPFCHNPALVNGRGEGGTLLPEADILAFLQKRTGLLDGVCLTGGEPLLHDSMLAFAAKIRALGFAVKLDTNGSFPDRLQEAVEGKLVDYVAMDIKNAPAKYAGTAGSDTALALVERSVEILKRGSVPYEFRTTVTGNLHEPADFAAIGQWIAGKEKYFLQPFLDSGEVLVPGAGYPVSAARMQECLDAVRPYVPQAAIRGAA